MTTTAPPVFASAAALYHHAGWPAVLPVPAETKSPPPTGYTGEEGQDTSAELLAAWAGNGYAGHSIALRLPDGIVGIDVDDYTTPSGKVKVGGQTLAAAEARWGLLPPTWSSTARGQGPSRIRFYRVPAGRYATVLRPDIEIIQRHHRYAVVWPSPHGDVGTAYTWYAPDGAPATRLPTPGELPELPPAWVDGLREGATDAAPASASHASGEALLAALSADDRPACSVMYDALDATARALADPDVGARHDAMTARTHRLVQSAAMGHAGLGAALPALRDQWAAVTAGEARDAEFERMLLSSARKAVTVLGGVQHLADPCTLPGGPGWAGLTGVTVDARPRPVDDRRAGEDDPEPFEPLHLQLPPKLVDPSWAQVVGTEAFDPGVDLDHPLADAMLRRCFYMARRASDTKSAWLLRGAEQWSMEGDLAGRVVSECAALMPDGDPTPVAKGEPASPAQRAYKRRLRMMTSGPAAAVAATMRRHTDGGRHPATVRIADLDREPDVLWAGGWPWDLRASAEVPTIATHLDPHGPHLVAAGVGPAPVPTPLWDAFLAAVWPDPEVRAWALRVLSIATTGYADAALPILFGEGGTGKTSLITLIMEVLGSYAHAADHRLLGSGEGHASIVFALKGRRLSFIDEAMREGTRNTERLKQLTGGGELTGNAMNQNPITFRPTHTLVLTSNTPPSVSDAAVRRRIRLLPCNGDPAEVRARRQALSGARWAAEAPGVLALLMREAAGWLANPDSALTSAAPLAVQFVMDELVGSQDVLGQWLTESVQPDEHGTRSHQLYVGFRGWCRDAGIRDSSILTETAWGRALNELGFGVLRRRDANYRPLVVRADPGFPQPSTPTPPPAASAPAPGAPSAVPGGSASPFAPRVEGLWGVGGGSIAVPSTTDNTMSPPVFVSPVEGVEGRSRHTVDGEEEQWKNTTHRRAVGANPPTLHTRGEEGENPQVAGAVDGVGGTNPPPRPSTPPTPAPEKAITPRSVSRTEAAARATEAKISKAEARRQLAEEKRLDAIATAQGEVLGLPAVVDRAGNTLPVTPAQAGEVVRAALARSGALTVDVETSGYPVGHADYELRSVQLGDEIAAAVLHPVDHASLVRELLAAAPVLHAHSATADLVPLAHAGLIDAESGWDRMHDTVIPAKLADPQSTGSDPGLKALAGAVLGAASTAPAADAARAALWKAGRWLTSTKVDTPPERSGWAQVATGSTTMLRYAASDVLDTAALARALPRPDAAVYERERLAQRMTARVAHRGVRIDAEHVREMTERHTAGRDAAAARVRALGVENPGSDQQVAEVALQLGAPLPRTATGRPSVAAGVLEPLRGAEGPLGELVGAVLDHRHHDTALGLFLEPYRLLCERGDGRARPTVYTLGTDTGRMSCVRPNLQQLSREGGVRACITADPGQLMIGADFSGVELRVAAALSQDPTLLAFLAEGRDLHGEIARQVWGEGATKANRYIAKRGVFGRIYGGGISTLATQVGVGHDVMQAVIDTLDGLTPGLAAWSASIREAVKRGATQYPSYSGRVIHLPREYPHKGPNYCIQGTARELLVDTLVRWRDTRWGTCTLLPVHDELDVFVPAEDAAEATAELVRCMETELLGVSIVADPSEPSYAWQDSV